MFQENPHYRLIKRFYANQRAKRSNVSYMQHIDEGLRVLDALHASIRAKEAYCLHPIVQSDEALRRALKEGGILARARVHPISLAIAMEYRRVANANLSVRVIRSFREIELGTLAEVREMLIADKVQNRKDFEIYHRKTHPRSKALSHYFSNWLRALGVSEREYARLARIAAGV